jgi:peptide-methionine (R)-S-oxide reductase
VVQSTFLNKDGNVKESLLYSVKKSVKNDDELSPELYRVAREGGTEAPYTGKFVDSKEKGMYACAVCGNKLFSSDTKFDSGTGWPSFTEPANLENIELKEDRKLGLKRTEVVCKDCGAHLGHVFDDGPKDKGGKRYCINSVCLDLQKQDANKQ